MHPLVASASASGLQPDIAESIAGIAARLDAELQNVDALSLDATRDLARRCHAAYSGAGGRADGWRNGAMATLAAREQALLSDTDELPNINTGTGGARLPASSIGSGAERRAARARQGYRRR